MNTVMTETGNFNLSRQNSDAIIKAKALSSQGALAGAARTICRIGKTSAVAAFEQPLQPTGRADRAVVGIA